MYLAMKQPELGRKLAFLRKEKGISQEELVDKCNINVRTIQRIESGDVTPRPITLRLILEALDYDFEMLNQEINSEVSNSSSHWLIWLQQFFLIGFDPSKNPCISSKIVKFAWIAGLVGFLIGFPESGMEYAQYYHRFDPDLSFIYTLIKVGSYIALVIMLRGFIILGDFHQNYLMKISTYLIIIHGLFNSIYDIVTVYIPEIHSKHADGGISITYGAILLLFGISLQKNKAQFGKVGSIAGVIAIISGSLFITLLLWWLGLLLLVPFEILEIVILYKGYEMMIKEKESHQSI
jgi:transcriptional regulator with XRE-family HTH domain